jgi:hypothetical protein
LLSNIKQLNQSSIFKMSLGNFDCVLDSFPAAYRDMKNIGVDNSPVLSPNTGNTVTIGGGGMSGNCTILPISMTSPGGAYDHVPVAFIVIIPNFAASSANSLSNVINFVSSFRPKSFFVAFPDQNNPAAVNVRLLPIYSPSNDIDGFRLANSGTTSATYIAFLCFGI